MSFSGEHIVTDKTKAEVCALKSFGNTHMEIAAYLGISDDTLARKYRLELDTAAIRANSVVANKLYHKATVENDLTAMIFWLKTRARWHEKDPEDKKADSVIEFLMAELKAKKVE